MKNTGSYYTPEKLAYFIYSHIKIHYNHKSSVSILEPSCGDGVFLKIIDKLTRSRELFIDAIEISSDALNKAKEIVFQNENLKTRFLNCDFLHKTIKKKYDLIIGNPPYISKKRLTKKQKNRCRQIHKKAGLREKCPPNIWTSFVLKSSELLAKNGILAFVLPAELLQVKYADEIQKYLYENFQKIEIITFKELLFDGIGQDTVILIAYKTSRTKGLFFADTKNLDTLTKGLSFGKNDLIMEEGLKWTAGILAEAEINLLIQSIKQLKPISHYSSSCPGVVTAANDYFIIDEQTIKKYRLDKYVLPIIRKGQYVRKWAEIDSDLFDEMIIKKYPCYLVNLGEKTSQEHSRLVSEYIELGEGRNIHERYKCRLRDPWYKIPSIWTSEAFFFKRTHHVPKLVKNSANVYVTDSAYRICVNENCCVNSMVYSFYNSLTLTFCELYGRFYGGGVLELTPNEFMNIPLPYLQISKKDFNCFVKVMNKNGKSVENCISNNDQTILKKQYGHDADSIATIQKIRAKLHKRRIRD
jgi:adenine-specific DNA-methyltransferase